LICEKIQRAARAVQALASVAAGNRADSQTIGARRRACAGCPNLTWHPVPLIGVSVAFCGTPLAETADTCGCAVGHATTDTEEAMRARMVATGAALVVGKECPSGKW
jgi:hypothetical protein